MIPASLAFYQGGYYRDAKSSEIIEEFVEIPLMNTEPILLPQENLTYFTQETDVFKVTTETEYMFPLWLTEGIPKALLSIYSGIPTVPVSLLENVEERLANLFPEEFGPKPM